MVWPRRASRQGITGSIAMSGRILVTGATGFVGRVLVRTLAARGLPVRSVVRREGSAGGDEVVVGDIGPGTDWTAALAGVDRVIHCAARVHQLNDRSADPVRAYRAVNTAGTLNLARQAAAAGTGRLVFLSSIKVNGEATPPGRPFTAADAPDPQDPYGLSKAEAEAGLLEMCAATGMSCTIVRPPLVYGPGVRANFASMMRWVARGLPLPLARADRNRRSLVGVDNLVDLLIRSVDHPGAANQIFLASDGDDMSTAELLRRLGAATGNPARLLPVPLGVLRFAATALGRGAVATRLLGSLQVDIEKTRGLLDWRPPVSVDEGLRRAAQAATA